MLKNDASNQYRFMEWSSSSSLYFYTDWCVSSIVENVLLKIKRNTMDKLWMHRAVKDDECRREREKRPVKRRIKTGLDEMV